MKKDNILLYPCNIIGYVRLAMLVATIILIAIYKNFHWDMSLALRFGIAIWLALSLLVLDVVDGYLARKFDHVTTFGALFELTIDLLSHTFVWTLSGLTIAPLFIALEWTAGLYAAAFTMRPDESWKNTLIEKGPWLMRVYWQRTSSINWLSVYSNIAHFLFPISLFVFSSFTWLSLVSLPGLIIFEVVTLYMVYVFLRLLVIEGRAG